MENRFFTADTHFGSERVLGYNRRPFKDTIAMDDALVSNWNRVVSTDDFVYHLGDFGNYDRLPELNGKIILILGNYEERERKER
ncbi:MAG: hypothetical protein LBD11_06895 [Candidatus Peribacteria bacterium]|jgi:calcineurin-like phosphoesterase family protein|nr:hypothetical protein [Candidatus Peribacteria bacterium]